MFIALVKVHEGVLGKLTFDAPPAFQQDFQLEPSNLGTLRLQADDTGQQKITVQLHNPLHKDQQIDFRISGTINLSNNQRLEIPSIQLLDATQLNRFLMLPTQIENRPMKWGMGRNFPGYLATPHLIQLSIRYHLRVPSESIRNFFFARERSYQGTLQKCGLAVFHS